MTTLNVISFGECMLEVQANGFGPAAFAYGGDTLNTAVYLRRCSRPQDIQVGYATGLGSDPLSQQLRHAWTPLFSVIRFDQASQGETRLSFLWNAMTWSKSAQAKKTEFDLGPLLKLVTTDSIKRISFLGGLFGVNQDGFRHWNIFGLEFSPSKAIVAQAH